MSSVLNIPEILTQVLCYLSRKDAFASALVSRHFYFCAQPSLWRSLESVKPLIKVAWPQYWQESYPLFPPIDEVPMAINISRMEALADQVRALEADVPGRSIFDGIDPKIVSTMATALKRTTLFPNLTRITTSVHCDGDLIACIPLLSQNITHLSIFYTGAISHSAFSRLTDSVAGGLPRLSVLSLSLADTTLTWDDPEMSPTLCKLLSELEDSLTELRLTCWTLTIDILEAVGRLPNLRRLFLTGSWGPVSIRTYRDRLSGGFPSLRTLWVEGPSLEALTQFINATESRHLERLYCGVWRGPNHPAKLHNFTASVASTYPLLEVFSLHCVHGTWNQSALSLWSDTMAPLHDNHRIKTVRLHLPFDIHTTDEDISNLSKAWPRLSEFHFSTPSGALLTPPKLTWKSLVTLATNCTDLRSLELYLDAQLDGPWAGSKLTHPPDLTRLSLGRSPISDPQAVAALLSKLVSRPSRLRVHWLKTALMDEFQDPDDFLLHGSRSERWKMVMNILQNGSEGKGLYWTDEGDLAFLVCEE